MAIKNSTKLKLHQVQGVNFLLAHNYVLNSDEQGLGKTLQSIVVQQSGNLDCLIICPFTLKYNWLEEYKKFTDEKDVKVGLKKAKINITNYENLYKCSELFRQAQMVVFDEAHYLINLEAQRTIYAHRMIEKYKPERMHLLTGTPVKERVPDFFSPLKLLSYTPIKNNGRLITDKYRTQTKFNSHFANRKTMTIKVKGRDGKYFPKKIHKYEGIQNEEELKIYMKFKYIRRLASKVLDLPPVMFKDVVASYKEDTPLAREFDKFIHGDEYNTKVKAAAALAIAPFTAEYIEELIRSGEKPIIVFSDHIKPLKLMAQKLKKYKSAFIIGEVDVKIRQRNITDFQSGLLDIIYCSYGAAATGITLTRSRNMVLNDETWEASSMSQALKRFHRIGQDRFCIVHRIIGSKVASRISKTLSDKQKDIDKLVD